MKKENDKNILLAAGGTGGHLYGAESLASELSLRGFNPFLFTDKSDQVQICKARKM